MYKKVILYGQDDQGYFKPKFSYYVDAYIDAYIHLNNNIDTGDSFDFAYYPLLYIYAHILELTLKHFKSIYAIIDQDEKIKKEHDLKKLWDPSVKKVLRDIPSRFTEERILFIGNLIDEVSKINKYQEVFRYPDYIASNKSSDYTDMNISHLIKSNDQLEVIREINNQFLAVEHLFSDLKSLGLSFSEVTKIEKFVGASDIIKYSDLEKQFKETACLVLIVLKIHYPSVSFDKSCKIPPREISLDKVQEVINISMERQNIYNEISKKYKSNGNMGVSREEIIEQISDGKLKYINELLKNKLYSFSDLELSALTALMSLGRDRAELLYYLSRDLGIGGELKEQTIEYLLEKSPLGMYLEDALSFL